MSEWSRGRLVELQRVAVRIVHRRDPPPGVLGDAAGELDALGAQLLDRLVQSALGLEGHDRAALATGRLAVLRVQAEPQAVGLELGPVVLLPAHREPSVSR